ncbi:MAG: DUF6777 domain-containing protein [Acidimicrobiia bacterium]
MLNSSDAPVRHRGLRPLLAVTTVLLLASLLVLPACSSDAEAATFQREPVDTPTADPFMKSVGTDDAGVTTPGNITAGAYSAKIPGLYGGSTDNRVCDPAALVSFLEADPDKAEAWAKVLDIETADIEAYVAKLTPVILRADTAVTNHGFKNGEATSIPAVLEAGTAVLVDDHGVPVVKCGCGNPLTAPPSTKDASFTGTAWTGFTPEAVTTVEGSDEPVARLVIADPSGTGIVRPIGTTGADDTPLDPSTITPDGEPTATTPGGSGTTTGVGDPTATAPGEADSSAADASADSDSNAENPDAPTPTNPAQPTGPAISFTGTSVPGAGCFDAPASATTVQITGRNSNRTVTLPSAAAGGFTGLVFAVNPDGSIDSEVTYEPPGAPGLVVTYRFQGQLTIEAPPTPSTLTGTLTATGAGNTCSVQYDATGQDLGNSEPSTTSTAPSEHITTYIATFGMAGSADPVVEERTTPCGRSQIFWAPWAITIRVRDEGTGRGEVTVEAAGYGGAPIAIYNPHPTADATGPVSPLGTFRVGGNRTYDHHYAGEFTSHWSGGVGASRTRPAEFLVKIHQTWDRDQDFFQWLNSSGGPDDFTCTYEVTAFRQA